MNQISIRVAILPPKYWWGFARYRTEEDLLICGLHVPKGFITDGTTVTRWFTIIGLLLIALAHEVSPWLYPVGVLGVVLPVLFPRVGASLKAAIVHDYLLSIGCSRLAADCQYKQVLQHLNVPAWRVHMMYTGVRLNSLYRRITRQ